MVSNDRSELIVRLRYLLPLCLCLAACAAPPSAPPTQLPTDNIEQLRQEQSALQMRVDELDNRLALMQAQLDEQQQQLDRTPTGSEMGTGSRQIAEPRVLPRPEPPVQETTSAAKTPTALYLGAFSSYAAGRYADAIDDFRQFLQDYPQNAFAGNAQFWLGECYYRQGLPTRAVSEFEKVVQLDAGGSKAPDALLRTVVIYRELNQLILAEQALQRLKSDYPDSAAARKAETY